MHASPLSVFCHPRTFWHGKYSGISRYICELVSHMEPLGVEYHIPIRETRNEYLKSADFFGRTSAETRPAALPARLIRKMLESTPLREKARRLELRSQALRYLTSERCDLIHPSHTNATEILPHVGDTPLVITVHDMTHELFPGNFASGDPTSRRKRLFAERADRIIAISRKTKEDLVELFHLNPDKVDVIHHGNSLTLPSDYASRPMSHPEQYILFVGKRSGYKNFSAFAEAFAVVSQRNPDIRLVCAGGGAFSREEGAVLAHLGIADKTSQVYVSDEELAILYNRSIAFVYPSLYEGFGLPILEAYACQAPVLCSHASCFPEVAGKGALYFEPDSIDSMVEAMTAVIQSPALSCRLKAAGAVRLADFSWEKTAQLTLESYQRAL